LAIDGTTVSHNAATTSRWRSVNSGILAFLLLGQ
jgi:hypothetical protein